MALDHTFARRPAAQTINEFCADNGISRSKLYQLWERGKGPRVMRVDAKILITAEAGAAWRAALESEYESGA